MAWGSHSEKEMIIGKVIFEISPKNDVHNNYETGYRLKVVVTTGVSIQIYNFLVCIVYLYQLEISFHIFDIGHLIDKEWDYCQKQWITHPKIDKRGDFPRWHHCYSLMIFVRHCWANLDTNKRQNMYVQLPTIHLFHANPYIRWQKWKL